MFAMIMLLKENILNSNNQMDKLSTIVSSRNNYAQFFIRWLEKHDKKQCCWEQQYMESMKLTE